MRALVQLERRLRDRQHTAAETEHGAARIALRRQRGAVAAAGIAALHRSREFERAGRLHPHPHARRRDRIGGATARQIDHDAVGQAERATHEQIAGLGNEEPVIVDVELADADGEQVAERLLLQVRLQDFRGGAGASSPETPRMLPT